MSRDFENKMNADMQCSNGYGLQHQINPHDSSYWLLPPSEIKPDTKSPLSVNVSKGKFASSASQGAPDVNR